MRVFGGLGFGYYGQCGRRLCKVFRCGQRAPDRQIAAGLGVDHKTVSAQRKELEATGGIRQLETNIGADGKERPRQAQRKPVVETTAGLLDIGATLAVAVTSRLVLAALRLSFSSIQKCHFY
jgi:DNA-binding Lrp family transcriptional regulator